MRRRRDYGGSWTAGWPAVRILLWLVFALALFVIGVLVL